MAFKSVFRWQHWRWRSRFWKKRARRAEAKLAAEVERNRSREDELLTVPMRVLGLFGIPPRNGPAPHVKHTPRQLTAVADPWDALTFADRQEFEMFWKPDAERVGVSVRDAQQKFLLELESRRHPLNDEQFS